MSNSKYILLAATAAALTASQGATAAGFSVSAQSASGMGNAYAGGAAVANDASTAFTNPAGLLKLDKAQFAVSGALTVTNVDYTDRGSLSNPLFGSQPVGLLPGVGPNENLNGAAASPGLYYGRKIRDRFAVGLALTVPFANKSDYGNDWVGRYQAVETEVTAFDINPSFAFKINDQISIGGGLSFQYADALLTTALDSGATCLGIATAAGLPVTNCSDIGLLPNDPSIDSEVRIDADGSQITFNLGLLYEPIEGTQIGVTYRHGTDHELDGEATFNTTAALGAFVGAFPAGLQPLQNTDATFAAELPPIFDASMAHQIHDQLQLLATFRWTGWSTFDNLTTGFENPAQPESIQPFNWEDAVWVSGGANFKLNQQITLRAGLAYDQTPVPSPEFRSVRGPANDRYWYSAGASYKINKNISADIGYTHIQIDESAIDNPGAPGNPTIRGEYEFDANLFAVQFNWTFN